MQRAKAWAFGHVRCTATVRTFRTRHHDEALCSAERSGRPPPLMAAYVEATNSFDLERLMATFAEDALVND